jgi:uncharacterized protein YbjQ (UPF0145 family)
MSNPEIICEKCKCVLKTGVFNKNTGSERSKNIINEYSGIKYGNLCEKCTGGLYTEAALKISKEILELTMFLNTNIHLVPILTTHSPHKWEYEAIGMVTGQTVTGTGVMSEFKSSFSDFFGGQSGSFNKKLKAGEDLCKAQLRIQTLEAGGNAIIATDIDYGEVGSEKGMLMVCMAGTAVKLKNPEILPYVDFITINQLIPANTRLTHLENLNRATDE